MGTWKTSVVRAVLRAGLIVTVAVTVSNRFDLGRPVADHAENSRQQQISAVDPMTPAEKVDMGQTPDTEPWGPFRTTDW